MNWMRVTVVVILSLSCSATSQSFGPGAAQAAASQGYIEIAIAGPVTIDSAAGRLYATTSDRKTAVLATADGSLLTTFGVGGPMALDSQRKRLYVSTEAGVAALDTETGQQLVMLPAISSRTQFGMGDFLPPLVDAATGNVVIVTGAKVSVFAPGSTKPLREVPFTVQGFDDPQKKPLVAQQLLFDPVRRLLYGSFIVHSQTSSGVGGSFTVYHVAVLDVVSGKIKDTWETYDLNRWALDATTGHLVVNVRGNASVWAGQDKWLATLSGIQLSANQSLQVDSKAGRVYAMASTNRLLAMDLRTLNVVGFTQLDETQSLAGYDPATANLYLTSEQGQLSVLPVASLRNTLRASAVGSSSTLPGSPVRSLTLLPDGRLAAQWEAGGVRFSRDGDLNWQNEVPEADGLAISSAFPTDHMALVASRGVGVFRSVDGGMSWALSSTGLRHLDVGRLFFSPASATDHTAYFYSRGDPNMFGFPRAGELYRSSDGGKTWKALPPRTQGLESIAVSDTGDGANYLVSVSAAGPSPGPGTFKFSPDGGASWADKGATPAFPADGGLSLAPLYAKWGVCFIFGTNGLLYRSADAGATWATVLDATSIPARWGYGNSWAEIASAPNMEANRPVFLVLRWEEIVDGQSQPRGALYVSRDGGQRWASAKLPGGQNPTAIAVPHGFAEDQRFYVGLSDGRVISLRLSDLTLGS